MASLVDMKWYRSTSGLGDAISATEILSQDAALSSAISGVTVIDAADNELGEGSLRYVVATDAFYYTPPDDSEGTAVVVSADGEVVVRGANSNSGYLRLDITYASLPVANATRTVTVTNSLNDIFDDVTKSEALDGRTEYRCIYLKNTAADSILGAGIWIHEDSVGGDSIAIGLDPAGVGGTATTIASETEAPSGVTFSQPASESACLSVGTMTTGQSVALWIRRTVPVGTVTAVPDDYSWLRFRILT
ncbi:MAG: hypothetical protein RLZ44_607 [Pseudomonadota bacterium]|jgi:hypothetical protein